MYREPSVSKASRYILANVTCTFKQAPPAKTLEVTNGVVIENPSDQGEPKNQKLKFPSPTVPAIIFVIIPPKIIKLPSQIKPCKPQYNKPYDFVPFHTSNIEPIESYLFYIANP